MRPHDDRARAARPPQPWSMSAWRRLLRSRGAVVAAALLLIGAGDPALQKSRDAEKKYRKGDLDAALKLYEDARKARPGTSALDYDVGVVKYRKGDSGKAQQDFSSALSGGDRKLRSATYYNIGNCLYQAHDYDGAAKAYQKALELTPSDGDAKHNLELSLRRKEEQPKPQQSQKSDKKDQKQDQKNQDQSAGNQDSHSDQKQQKSSQESKQGDQGQQKPDQDQSHAENQTSPDQKPSSDQNREDAARKQGTPGADSSGASIDPNAMKPEDAKRLLDALRDEEERALTARQEQNAQEAGVVRDW